MSFKKIMLVFSVCAPLAVAARFLQLLIATEGSTGLYRRGFETFGNIMLVCILLAAAVVAFCAYKAYKTPEKPPKNNLWMSVSAGLLAVSLAGEVLFQKLPITNPAWQLAVLKFVTSICMAYFVAVALQGVLKFKIPAICHAIPFFYFVGKAIFVFISISSLAIISDNVLLMTAYCLLMLFSINYGKLYNNLDTDLNFRKILATGLSSAVVCGAQAVAYFGVNILGKTEYLHTDITAIFTLLAFAIFTTVFIVSHFHKTA